MATSTSPARSARNIVDMQLVEYSFARWVYIDKCDDFVDAFGIPTLDMKAVADTLGSDATCIRALVLHGHLASGRQRRHTRTPSRVRADRLRRLTPLEAFKEALQIGLAAAEDPNNVVVVDVMTRPWERTSQSIYWLPVSPPPDLPVFIPRPLSSLAWNTVKPSGTTTVSGTNLICAPRELSTSQINPARSVDCDLSAVWSCNEARVVYRNGECTVYPRSPGTKPFVVTGLPAAQPRVLHHCKLDREAGPLHTTARPASSQDVEDTPMLLIWSCVHGDLFVQTPATQVPTLPPTCSFDFMHTSNPSSSSNHRFIPTSVKQYAPLGPNCHPRSPPPAINSSPTPAPRSQPVFPSGRPHPRQKQRLSLPSSGPYFVPAIFPPVSQRSTQGMKEQGTAHPKAASLAVRPAGPTTQTLPDTQSASCPAPRSLSVFQPRGASEGVPPSFVPQTPVSEKRVRHGHPTPSQSSSPISAPPSSPTTGPSNHVDPTPPTPTPSEPAPPVSSEKMPCGFDNCTTLLTPRSWEKHYDEVHDISERTWVMNSLCSHPTCREAQATAMARGASQAKLTIGRWSTYKRHIRQVHFPGGRTHPCTSPGCKAVLSRPDSLLRHVEGKHGVVHAGRERPSKRLGMECVVDHEESPAKKKARTITSPTKQWIPCVEASRTTTSDKGGRASLTLTLPPSQKGKETARDYNTKDNRRTKPTSASSVASPSSIKVGDEDVDMVDEEEDEEMAQSEDEYDDEWPQGDIIEDEMNFDPDNYY